MDFRLKSASAIASSMRLPPGSFISLDEPVGVGNELYDAHAPAPFTSPSSSAASGFGDKLRRGIAAPAPAALGRALVVEAAVRTEIVA